MGASRPDYGSHYLRWACKPRAVMLAPCGYSIGSSKVSSFTNTAEVCEAVTGFMPSLYRAPPGEARLGQNFCRPANGRELVEPSLSQMIARSAGFALSAHRAFRQGWTNCSMAVRDSAARCWSEPRTHRSGVSRQSPCPPLTRLRCARASAGGVQRSRY